MQGIKTIAGVCEVWTVAGPEADPDAPPNLLFELPHGATQLQHLQEAKKPIHSYPGDRYDRFFLANTDQGSPEYALALAKRLCDVDATAAADFEPGLRRTAVLQAKSRKVMLVRALLPRTLVDVNRVWRADVDFQKADLTGVIAPFIKDAAETAYLHKRYKSYQDVAHKAYRMVCGNGGYALNLHTYAPISVSVPDADADIVTVLEQAYTPENYARHPLRPEVQLITTTPEGVCLSPEPLTNAIKGFYQAAGIEVQENHPFNLHPATTAARHAATWPRRVLTVEISRKTLSDPFDIFSEMKISPQKTAHMIGPLALGTALFLAQSAAPL